MSREERVIKELKNFEKKLKELGWDTHNFELAYDSLLKQVPQKVNKGEYNADSDCYFLECPSCKDIVGSLDNEDNDGEYKYNVYDNYCPNCGQKLVKIYTEEEIIKMYE